MSNDITELRSVLFDTLRDLRNKEATIDIERCSAINDIAQTIIQTAKVEVDHMRVTGGTSSSGFLPAPTTLPPIKTMVPAPPAQKGVAQQLVEANVTTHKMD
jgi:hypothetical protein